MWWYWDQVGSATQWRIGGGNGLEMLVGGWSGRVRAVAVVVVWRSKRVRNVLSR